MSFVINDIIIIVFSVAAQREQRIVSPQKNRAEVPAAQTSLDFGSLIGNITKPAVLPTLPEQSVEGKREGTAHIHKYA